MKNRKARALPGPAKKLLERSFFDLQELLKKDVIDRVRYIFLIFYPLGVRVDYCDRENRPCDVFFRFFRLLKNAWECDKL